MKDVAAFLIYTILVSVPTLSAAYVAAAGKSSWTWFLLITLLILFGVKGKFNIGNDKVEDQI